MRKNESEPFGHVGHMVLIAIPIFHLVTFTLEYQAYEHNNCRFLAEKQTNKSSFSMQMYVHTLTHTSHMLEFLRIDFQFAYVHYNFHCYRVYEYKSSHFQVVTISLRQPSANFSVSLEIMNAAFWGCMHVAVLRAIHSNDFDVIVLFVLIQKMNFSSNSSAVTQESFFPISFYSIQHIGIIVKPEIFIGILYIFRI